jgi:hypothetical protein
MSSSPQDCRTVVSSSLEGDNCEQIQMEERPVATETHIARRGVFVRVGQRGFLVHASCWILEQALVSYSGRPSEGSRCHAGDRT